MGKGCAVAGCSNSIKTGHSVHLFPKDEQQRLLWIRFVKLTSVDFSEPNPNSAICSAHFSDDCYEVDRIKFKELFGMSTNKRLLPNSVPSIYPKRPPEVINMINEAKNMRKKLKTSVTPQKREKVKEMPKKKMKALSTIVKENKERIRRMRPKKIREKGEQEALKLQITNSSTRPESGAPMKRRKETEKYNMTTSEVPPVKKMKLEQILKCGNKQEKLVNKKLESADEISKQSVVNVTVTRRVLRSDIGTDVSVDKGNSLLATSTNLTDKTQNMRSLLPMNMMNISTDKKTQNARSLLPFNITDEKTQIARNSQPLNITMDKKTQNLRSLLTFQISTDKSTQNSRSLLPFKITDKKSQNERSLFPPNASTGNKKEDLNSLSPLNADHSNMKQNPKSLSPLKAGLETENQGTRSLLSLNAGQVTESQNARSLLSFNSGPVTEGQSSTSLLSLDAGQVILTESQSAGQVILTENQSAGQVAKSQSSRSLLSLNAGQVTKSRNARSLLSLDASPVTKGENAGSLLSLETSPVTKDQNARSLLSLETIPVTKSQNARSLLSLDASQVSNSQNPKSLLSLNAGAVTESQNARSLLLSLKTSPVSKSQNARSLLPLNIGTACDIKNARSLLPLNIGTACDIKNARSLLPLNIGTVCDTKNARSLLPLNIGTACDTKNARSLLHNVKLPLKSGTVIKTQNQEIFQSSLLENKSQREHSKNSVSSIKDCQQKGSEEEPSQTVQSVLDTENVQENIFSVCINRTKGSPDVKIIQPGIGKEVIKKNRLENLLKQSKLCTHGLQTESKKENLQDLCTTQTSVTIPSKERKENLQSTTPTSVTKPSKERKSQSNLRRGRRLKEKYKYKSLSEESETETDKPASLLRSRGITDLQVQDLSWLLSIFTHGINGILAEEMGLSKTVQAIALLGYMKDYQHISGPHLFIVPLTDIDHWVEEFKRWSPESRLVVIKGTVEQRRPAFKDILKEDGWDVCITSCETCLQEPNVFKEINWRYLAVDEDQTIIKEKTQISEIIQSMKTSNKLLLTGTQTQNDLQELLALQNFLLHDSTYNTICRSANQLCDKELVSCLHNILHPFLLKRIKADLEKGLLPSKEIYIYIGLYTLQRDWQTIQAQDLKEQLNDNMNREVSEKKMEILKHVSLPNQSKLEIIQPCKVINPSVGLKSLLKDNTSIGNRTQSRKTLQSILPANKSTQGSFQKNFTKSYSLNGLLTKGSGEGSSQNVQITSDCRNSPERIFSVCVESLKGSPNIKIIQQAGVEKKVEQNKVNFDLQSCPNELSIRHKLQRNKKYTTELNAKVEGKDNYSNEEESNESEDEKKNKSSDDEIFLKDKLSGSEIQEKYLSFVKHYINGEFEYKGTRKLNCIPAVSDHQSVCPCIVCGDQSVGMYFGIMVCYSCRTFIVATVQYRSILKCEEQSNCTIYFRKEICPHCRFKKCLWAGAVVAEVPLRLQKLSKFKQSLTVKKKKQPKRNTKRIKMKTCVKPATATRQTPTMYLTSGTDCDNKDDCDKLVGNSYPIKSSVEMKDNPYPIKSSGGQKDNSYPIKLSGGQIHHSCPIKSSGGQKDNSYPIKSSGGQKDNYYAIKLSGGQKANSYPIKLSGGQKGNSHPIKSSGGQKNHINEKLTSISSIKSESSQVTLCSVIKETISTEIQLKPLSENHNMEDNFHYFKQNSRPISTSDILTDWQRLHKSVQEQFQKLKN
ncbi:uncharacterized protein LOC143042846 isoform X2 [Mytilus galloprovincialis]|uniref:uncharacterized protein LOC143042846 isoform X2 n=1 Tax=Mytilus galloprovincialis TaxID=29158 RepID=UPI003F7BAD58